MNEESHNSLIEPELEARIVALVLGEASDFECEELNRLIALRPELAAFKLQMQQVHGLLQVVGAGEFAAPDNDWKLPNESRNAILAVIRGEANALRREGDVNLLINPVAINLVDTIKAQIDPAEIRGLTSPARRIAVVAKSKSTPSVRGSLSKLAAVVCVAGCIGIVTFWSFISEERANTDYFYSIAKTDAPRGGFAAFELSGGTNLFFAREPESGVPNVEFFGRATSEEGRRALGMAEQKNNPEVALSAIQDTLSLASSLSSGSDQSDFGLFASNAPAFEVPEDTLTEHKSWSADADSPELIAKNETTWMYRGSQNREQFGDGRADSQLPMPSFDDGVLSRLGNIDAWDEKSETAPPASVRLRSVAPDGGKVLLDEISAPLVPDAAISPPERREFSLENVIENGELPASGMSLEIAETDVAVPATESELLQAEQPLQELEGIEHRFSKDQLASPDSDFDYKVEQSDKAHISPGGPPAGGRGLGESLGKSTKGAFGFGGGISGGLGVDQPPTNLAIEMPTEVKRKADADIDGIASFDVSGLQKSSQFETLARDTTAESHAPVDSLQTDALESLRQKFSQPQAKDADGETIQSEQFIPADQPMALSRRDLKSEELDVGDKTRELERKTKADDMPTDDRYIVQITEPGKPIASTATDKSEQSYTVKGSADGSSNADAKSWKLLPSEQNGQQVESRLKSDVDGDSYEFYVPFRDDLSTPSDDARSSRKEAATVAPSAGLNETTASAEPFSTFSLHVSDVSFKLAFASLGRGEWPEAATVRIEEFVNAFDYGDPLPCKDEKVACRIEQSIHPFVQQRNLLRISMRTAAAGRSASTPLRLTFLLDNSGSMERTDRQQTVRRAFALLAQQLTPIDQVTLISFARQPRLLADKVSGSDAGQLVQLIDELPREGGTNMEAALQLAYEKAREQQSPEGQNRIILLTDGAVNLGNADPESLSQMVTSMRSTGIAFDAAGISADGLNDEVLEALTRKGDGRYYLLDSVESADDGFVRQIAGALRPSAKNVKVQIEFNPKRVGHYKLLGFEKHFLKKEDFRNDAVDAAEMAAAEAGVAMYQFEAKPDGEGDVGSVSVRFQDLSTGEMIENRWPVPYEVDAPRADQAAPSLRIATSAALLAAKLRGEPLGEAVDLQTLSHLISGLPVQERSDTRVQQLQTMIEQARQLSQK